jgi:hypothetical protein
VTEKDQSAKIGEMVQQRKSLKEKIAGLEHELSQFSMEWHMMSLIPDDRNFSSDRYVVEGDDVKVMRRSVIFGSQGEDYRVDRTVSLKSFDREAIVRLLADLSETRNELERVMRQLAPFGINS